jgi:DNA-binding NtrC family response regulator
LLEAADGGTLFLDEVGNLPMNVQKTLLRFLQEQEFLRIGETTPTRVDVRIISATNSDLKATVKTGTFREDLYYRLNVVNIHLPPLRERPSDIALLAAHFITLQNKKFGTKIKGLRQEAMEAAASYEWPGNIRQLKNVIEACMAMESGDYISLPVLGQFIDLLQENDASGVADQEGEEGEYSRALSRFEMDYLKGLLRKNKGNIDSAAREAGMNMATIYRKIKKYGIKKEDYS